MGFDTVNTTEEDKIIGAHQRIFKPCSIVPSCRRSKNQFSSNSMKCASKTTGTNGGHQGIRAFAIQLTLFSMHMYFAICVEESHEIFSILSSSCPDQ